MMKFKREIAGFEIVLMMVSLFAFSFMLAGTATVVTAQTATSDASACCEKTNDGAWCMNAPESECDTNYNAAPTSCETTSYCRLGTCYESEEGICMENTPQRVCNDNGGTWDSREIEEVPQCQLGCCIVADQAAFVSLVRCKKLSTLFGVENNYRTDIKDEVSCISEAQSQDIGACVYEKDFERFCEFTTREDCGASKVVETISQTNLTSQGQKTFYKDFLCSAEELNTACAKQTSTNCYQGDVYWADSCGNRENVYSNDKVKSWNSGKVAVAGTICAANDGSNINCGNCDYMLGSRCAEFTGITGGPADGDNYCQKTECIDSEGNKRINGESWCDYDNTVGNGGDMAGSRYFREICIDGDVQVEPCADFRNEVCIEGSIETTAGDFKTASCRVNRWQDCVAQEGQGNCINTDQRDCIWLGPVTGMVLGGQQQSGSSFSNPTSAGAAFTNPTATGGVTGMAVSPITGQSIFGGDDAESPQETATTNRASGVCVPNFPPGLNFWDKSSAQQICGQANAKCVVVYEKGLIGGKKIIEGEECLNEQWALDANRICTSLGDCGGYTNYQGQYTDDGYKWTTDGVENKFSPNNVNIIKGGGIAGMAIAPIVGLAIKSAGAITGMVSAPAIGSTEVADGRTWSYMGNNEWTDSMGNIRQATTSSELVSEIPAPSAANIPASPPVTEVVKSVDSATLVKISDPIRYTTTGTLQIPGGVTIPNGANIVVDSTGAGTYTAASGEAVSLTKAQVDGAISNNLIKAPAAASAAPAAKSTNQLSSIFGFEAGGAADAIATGFQWAAYAYMAGQMIGGMMGLTDQNKKALSTAMAAGFGSYSLLNTYEATQGGIYGVSPGIIGLGIGVVVFIAMYKKTETKIIEFNCMPWQASVGGDNCEVCNDPNLPCSEYRCKSLGQNCDIVNPGTADEKCVNINPRDVNPPIIRPSMQELTKGHQYTNVKNSPPGPGFKIINTGSSDGCLKAFTPLEFGISTNEPAQCKIDFNHTTKFDDMISYVGGSNLYLYNHSEKFSLPNAKTIKDSSLELQNGKDLTFYIRCKDKNGNENAAEYAVNFCVDPTPDSTAPEIESTSVINGGCVAEDQNTAEVRFYTNEPADCRWSPQDQDYDNMQNTMTCNNEIYQSNAAQLFTCVSELTGISRQDTKFYIRCKDQPGAEEGARNKNKQSFEFNLVGSTGLKLKNIQPNGTVSGSVSPFPIELRAETLFGCNEGQAVCKYSATGNANDYIQFFDTNTEDGVHTQRLDLAAGTHQYFVQCIDAGGNLAEDNVTFTLDIDTSAPVIARIYEEDQMLKIITIKDSECSYTFDNCDFSFDEGTTMPYANSSIHVAEWKDDKTYYIKCRDEFRNEEADCSAVVRPTQNFLL